MSHQEMYVLLLDVTTRPYKFCSVHLAAHQTGDLLLVLGYKLQDLQRKQRIFDPSSESWMHQLHLDGLRSF
jgi:hypothetical protein